MSSPLRVTVLSINCLISDSVSANAKSPMFPRKFFIDSVTLKEYSIKEYFTNKSFRWGSCGFIDLQSVLNVGSEFGSEFLCLLSKLIEIPNDLLDVVLAECVLDSSFELVKKIGSGRFFFSQSELQ